MMNAVSLASNLKSGPLTNDTSALISTEELRPICLIALRQIGVRFFLSSTKYSAYLPFTLAIVLKFLYHNRTSEILRKEELRIMQYTEYSAWTHS
jgi:hypothetical protein